MTPEERIAQLTKERAGGVVTLPRRPAVAVDYQPAKPADPVSGFALPGSWRSIPDRYDNNGRRDCLCRLETKLAAWAVARLLGPDWDYREPSLERRYPSFDIFHKEGYGVRLSCVWNDNSRFRVVPLRRHRRDVGPPAEITISASRPLGAIAADISRRMVEAGLKQAHDDDLSAERARSNEEKKDFDAIRAICKAAGGHITDRRRWSNHGSPEASIPGGVARCYYDDRIEIELLTTHDEAIQIAASLKQLTKGAL